MSNDPAARPTESPRRDPREDTASQGLAAGATIAASVLMVAVGILQFLQGLSALANDDILIVGPEYVYTLSTTAWGWIHLIVGAIVAIAGFCLFAGALWARVVAIFIAAISIIANFLWLPYYPLWSIVLIAMDVVIIWAVATWNTDSNRSPSGSYY